ncbi:MAG: sulfatase [Armatimonadota bacterium]
MKRRDFLKNLGAGMTTLGCAAASAGENSRARKPNIVFIFIDDMGYGDIGPFGSTQNKTPNLDRMAAQGNKLTQFYVSSTACTPSRASLMTGCHADRIGMDGRVLFPADVRGLNPDEITIAELLKAQGYATGCFGKWHLGDQPEFLPLQQGFDEYIGIPYSNDMWSPSPRREYPPLPIVEGSRPVAHVSDGADQALLCEVLTDAAVSFMQRHRGEPFFVYLPHAFVHGPRFSRMANLEKAGGNVVRAQVEEVDWSVGQILKTVEELGLANDTLVIFTSDNGGAGGMSMGPLRGGKGGPKYEGHMRAPTLAWWPRRIPAGAVTDEIGATSDVLPTLARLTGTEPPRDRVIDGHDILPLLLAEPGATSPHEVLFYEVGGVRRGKWKLVQLRKGVTELYDLEADLGEQNDVAAQFPGRVAELKSLLDQHAAALQADRRPAAFVEGPTPLLTTTDGLPKLAEYMGMPDLQASDGREPKR